MSQILGIVTLNKCCWSINTIKNSKPHLIYTRTCNFLFSGSRGARQPSEWSRDQGMIFEVLILLSVALVQQFSISNSYSFHNRTIMHSSVSPSIEERDQTLESSLRVALHLRTFPSLQQTESITFTISISSRPDKIISFWYWCNLNRLCF